MDQNKKSGRPTDKPKNVVIKARIDTSLQHKLDYCAKKLCLSKSDVIRDSIQKTYKILSEQGK